MRCQIRLLLACVILQVFVMRSSATPFDCTELAEVSMRNDDKLLEVLQQRGDKTITTQCIGSLVRGNHFKSAIFAIDTLQGDIE